MKSEISACRFLTLGIFLFLVSCKASEGPLGSDPGPSGEIGKAQVWLTKGDRSKLLNYEGELSIKKTTSANWPVIEIDTASRFQSMDGFGAALTGSSAYLLNKKMDAAARQATLRKLFDPADGIGISFLRLTIGASDFSLSDFTYDDMPAGQADTALQQFSLSRDNEDVVPVIKEILKLSPAVKLIGSPWSPPAWMKTNGSMKGGKLKPEYYGAYAAYFARYILEMKNQGVTIPAITLQNEPLYFTANYPCMEMQPTEQLTFIKDFLGPKFNSAGIDAKIYIYDHNWDNTNYAISILNDPDARKYIAGTAFHAYAGDVSAMGTVHNAHPDKELYFTEISGGDWATDFGANLVWYMKNIFIGTIQNWSKCVLMWNLVLDQDHGPTNNGCADCRGVVTLNVLNGQVSNNEEYYAIGHFSKFVKLGAVRIASILPPALSDLLAVAFQNPDGSKVMVLCNSGSSLKTFGVKQGERSFLYSVPGQSVVSITW